MPFLPPCAVKLPKFPDSQFTRQTLLADELDRIVTESASLGATPHQTMSRELQELRDSGVIEFVDNRGTYRLKG